MEPTLEDGELERSGTPCDSQQDFQQALANQQSSRRPVRTRSSLMKRSQDFEHECLTRLKQLECEMKSCHTVLYRKLELLGGSLRNCPDSGLYANGMSCADADKAQLTSDELSVKSGSIAESIVPQKLLHTGQTPPPMSHDVSAPPSILGSRRPSLTSESVISKSGVSVAPSVGMDFIKYGIAAEVAKEISNGSNSGAVTPSPRSIGHARIPKAKNINRESREIAFNNVMSSASLCSNVAVRSGSSFAPGRMSMGSRDSGVINVGSNDSAAKQAELAVNLFARRNKRSEIANMAWNFMENPESSVAAGIYAMMEPTFLLFTVMLSLLPTMKRTAYHEEAIPPVITRSADFTVDAMFMAEVIIRYLVSNNKSLHYFLQPLNIIDVTAAVPLFARTIMVVAQYDAQDFDALFCLVAVIRLLKMVRRFQKMHLLVGAFQRAFEALPVLFYTGAIITLFFSSAVYLVEPRDNFESLPMAMWFTIVTMTTVGYGDIVPVSVEGTCIATALTISSVLYMAVPLGIVGHAFTAVWQDRDRILLVKKTQAALMQWGYTAIDIPMVFSIFDSQGEGELNMSDFRRMITQMRIGLSDGRILDLFNSFDVDGDGYVNDREFVRHVFPMAYDEVYGEGGFEDEVAPEAPAADSDGPTKCECGNTFVPGGEFCGMCGRHQSGNLSDSSAELPGMLDAGSNHGSLSGTNREFQAQHEDAPGNTSEGTLDQISQGTNSFQLSTKTP